MVIQGFPRNSVAKNLPAMQEMQGSIPGLGRSPEGGHGNQYSCLENLMDRRSWWATVCGVKKSWTQPVTKLTPTPPTHTHRVINVL